MTFKPRLLIVEDEAAIRVGLVDVFTYHGYDVESATDGERAWQMLNRGPWALVLLDVMLPGIDGFELLRRLRERDRDLPVILLTARGTEEDVIEGLSLGADDYVAKPFSVAALVLRVQAVLRRAGLLPSDGRRLTLAEGIEVDSGTLSALRDGQSLPLTRREMDLLLYLHAHADRAVSRDELLHKVWGYGNAPDLETRTVDIHVAKLRRKLERDPAAPRVLLTVRGAGYRLVRA
ncbi:MAG: response regulator transcription factor [Gammaproteobacteria bacterium]